MADRVGEPCLGVLFAVLLCIAKLGLGIFTPLYLDCLNPTHTVLYNISLNFTNDSTSGRYGGTYRFKSFGYSDKNVDLNFQGGLNCRVLCY